MSEIQPDKQATACKTLIRGAVCITRLLCKGMGYPLPEVWRVADRSQGQVMAHYLTSTVAALNVTD
ncbi:MAG: hypothetical protein KKB51_23740 [Candidatus Riflebacteria bacterium]|nr:hypothetical protein [Candidatus Riflebacteria bacterium]